MIPGMPEVDRDRDIGACIARARTVSAGSVDRPDERPNGRCVSVVTPGGLIVPVSCPPPEAVSSEMLADVRRIVPPQPPLAITVISFSDLVGQEALTPSQINEMIPFLGYLLGLAFDGHTVVVFEGHPAAFEAGCRDSDLLIVDGAMVRLLQKDWVLATRRAMRQPRVLVFGRNGGITAVGHPPC